MPEPIQVNWEQWEQQEKEGTGHIKFGVGVGLFGATSLAVIGATCPLCFFVAPAMVGLGVVKRHKAKKELRKREEQGFESDADEGLDGSI